MAQISYLKKRGAIYYAQIPVPKDVQHIIPGKTKERSLKTKDLKVAKGLLPDFLSEWQDRQCRGDLNLASADQCANGYALVSVAGSVRWRDPGFRP